MNPSGRPHIFNLTGIRGYAAMWVVFYHFFSEINILLPETQWIANFSIQGHLAVELFFQLSGFVLAYNYAEKFSQKIHRADLITFIFNRFARVYPVHFVTLLCVLAMYWVGRKMGVDLDPAGYTFSLFLQNLFLVHAWVPKLQLSWNYPSWSVSCEWLAYISFPFIVGYFLRLKNVLGSLCGVVFFTTLSYLFMYFMPKLQFQEVLRIVIHFSVGLCLYPLYLRVRLPQQVANLILVVSMVVVFLGPDLLGKSFPYLAFTVFPLLILALAQLHKPNVVFGSRWSIYWGEASYALYMSHAVAQKVLYSLLPVQKISQDPTLMRWAWFLVYVFVIAASAVALHHIVENPSRRWLRRKLLPRLVRPG